MPRGGMEYEHTKNIMEAMTDIRDRTEAWRVSALWKKKGACFYKVRRDGTIRLYRTSEGIGFCWADLRMAAIRGGGTAMLVKTAATNGIKLFAWVLCVICLFMVAHDWVEYRSVVLLLRDVPYLLLAGVAVLLTAMAGRETPKLIQFIEQDLGWKRAR